MEEPAPDPVAPTRRAHVCAHTCRHAHARMCTHINVHSCMRVRTHAHTQAHTHVNTGAHTEATQGCLPWEARLSLPPADFSGPAGPCAFLPPAKVTLGCFVNPSGQSSRCQDTHFSWNVGVRTFPRASRGPRVSSNEHTAGKVGLAGPGGSERLKGHGLHGTSIFTSLDLQSSTWGSERLRR